MNRRVIVSILALVLVVAMVMSLLLIFVPASASAEGLPCSESVCCTELPGSAQTACCTAADMPGSH